MNQPYTAEDLAMGEQIVRELHGLRGYDAWAERIAKAISAERERLSTGQQKQGDDKSNDA